MSQAAHRFNNDLRYRDGSHERNVQLTPDYILDPVREDLGGTIELDPCTTPDNPVGAEWFFSPPVDGIAQEWNGRSIFVNPPYGKAREPWVEKCIHAGSCGIKVALLIPAHTDTRIFQRAAQTAHDLLFIRGRVKFGILRPNRRQFAASHPSVLIGWNVLFEHSDHLGLRVIGNSCPEWEQAQGEKP